jgi:oxygen-independent coproporphyrinogen-3 oxidase
MVSPLADDRTAVGSYFVSNYPPYSTWTPEQLPALEDAFHRASEPCTGDSERALGLYLHIPFCRKRCKFCYFKVYTEQNSRDVDRYLSALGREVSSIWDLPAVRGRNVDFVYFGGGTPSYLSSKQLATLVERLPADLRWTDAREVTFECEPGTLQESKVHAIRDIGVTRLSLGVENFDDAILEENGRAHRSPEVYRAYEWIRGAGFASVNIDLIAGMVGETDANWSDCIRKTLDLAPESVTIYQMELPYNAIYSRDVTTERSPVADWRTKRRWVAEAFDAFESAGYLVSSAYTLVRDATVRFEYRDSLWHGADLLGAGVSSFGHISGIHYQNQSQIEEYQRLVESGRHPWQRAFATSLEQRWIREFILQLKTGRIETAYFRKKFGIDPISKSEAALRAHRDAGWLAFDDAEIRLTREGLLRVDGLLESFFEPRYTGVRYT